MIVIQDVFPAAISMWCILHLLFPSNLVYRCSICCTSTKDFLFTTTLPILFTSYSFKWLTFVQCIAQNQLHRIVLPISTFTNDGETVCHFEHSINADAYNFFRLSRHIDSITSAFQLIHEQLLCSTFHNYHLLMLYQRVMVKMYIFINFHSNDGLPLLIFSS